MTTKDLVEFIRQNTRVILPEFGAFLVKESSEKGFNPSNLTFSPFLRYNDGMLEVYIAKNRGISKEEASKLIHAFIDEIKNELQEKGVFQIETLGSLKRDSRGSITFVLSDLSKKIPPVEKPIVVTPPQEIIPKKTESIKVPEVDERKDPWADDPTEEPKTEVQKKFRRIEGKRAQVEKLTISRIPINKDLISSSDGTDPDKDTFPAEELKSMFVPVTNTKEPQKDLPTEEVKKEIIIQEPVKKEDAKIEPEVVPKKRKSTKKVEPEIIEKIEESHTIEPVVEKSNEIDSIENQTAKEVEVKGELIEIESSINSEPVEKKQIPEPVSPIIIEPVKAEAKSNQTENKKELKTGVDEKKGDTSSVGMKMEPTEEGVDRSYSSLIITIGVIAVVLVLFLVGRHYFFSPESDLTVDSSATSSLENQNDSDKVTSNQNVSADEIDQTFNDLNETDAGKITSEKEVEKKQIENEEAIKEELIKNANAQVISGVNYYVVVGSFKNPDYAKKYSEKISKSGYQTEIVMQKSGMHAVSIGRFNTRDQAENKQSSVAEQFPGVWILKQ